VMPLFLIALLMSFSMFGGSLMVVLLFPIIQEICNVSDNINLSV
jgi:hypothetical protein